MATLEDAIEFAVIFHAGQKDKQGYPYIFHPLRVMLSLHDLFKSDPISSAGVLHDVIEDTACTLETLREAGFTEFVIEMVDSLTRRSGEDYETYLRRLSKNNFAVTVKEADLRDKLSPERIDGLSQSERRRLMHKYGNALAILSEFVV